MERESRDGDLLSRVTRMKHRPCKDCPWRRDAPPEYWDPEHFVRIAETCRNDGWHIMLCHKSSPTQEPGVVCAGWAAVEGLTR